MSCNTCKYYKDNHCEQEDRMTDAEYEDYFIDGIKCPYYKSNSRTRNIMDVVCEFMAEVVGSPCEITDKGPRPNSKCEADCNKEACWRKTFQMIKEKKDEQNGI